MAAKKVKDSDITVKLQIDTERTFIAQWKWSRDYTLGFDIEWQYYTKDGIWFDGETKQVGAQTRLVTYTTASLAIRVAFRVRPYSSTHIVNQKTSTVVPSNASPNDKYLVSKKTVTAAKVVTTTTKAEVARWEAEWSGWIMQDVPEKKKEDDKPEEKPPDYHPAVPNVPNMSMNGLTVTVRVETYDANTTHIQFDIVRNDSIVGQTQTAFMTPVTGVVSFTTNVSPGYQYKARARAWNQKHNLYSEWSAYSSNANTPPDGYDRPPACQATSATSVKLSWDTNCEGATGYEIEYAKDPEYFDQSNLAQSTTVGATSPYAIITGLETGQMWYFRVRATNAEGKSEWFPICSCLLGTTPTAPTVWSSAYTAIYGDTVTLYWVHNCEDGSRERTADLRITLPDGTQRNQTITKSDDSDFSSYDISINNTSWEGSVSWKVRTTGITNEYGPYSEVTTFKVLIQPTLSIACYKDKEWLWNPFNFETDDIYSAKGVFTHPYWGDDIRILYYPFFFIATMYPMSQEPIECNFSIYATSNYRTLDHTGQDMWVNSGDLLFSETVVYDEPSAETGLTKNQIALTITPGNTILENYTTYKMVCTAVSNNGLAATGTYVFTLDLEDDDMIPDAEIGIDEEAIIAYIRPTCTTEVGEIVDGVRMSVYRRQFDGGLIQVGAETDSMAFTMLVDPHPNLNWARYRIVGFSSKTGRYVYYDMPGYPVHIPEIILQWGERWNEFNPVTPDSLSDPVWSGSMVRLPYNIDSSESNAGDVELVEYIGREHPVSYYGTQVGQTMTLSTDIEKTDEDVIYALRRLSRYMGDVYVREPTGAGYWAHVQVSINITHNEPAVPVTLNITRVEGGE